MLVCYHRYRASVMRLEAAVIDVLSVLSGPAELVRLLRFWPDQFWQLFP